MESLWTLLLWYSYVICAMIHLDTFACYVQLNKASSLILYTKAPFRLRSHERLVSRACFACVNVLLFGFSCSD